MPRELPSRRITVARDSHLRLMRFFEESRYFERYGDPESLFLAMGDPHELPPAGYVEAIREQLEPRRPTWFSYKTSIPEAQEVVATSLRRWRGLPFEAADVALTTGAFGAIAAAMTALLDPGDEVIINTPPWFNYDGMALARSAVPVKVPTRADFDLDLAAVEMAITPATRLVIVNTPNNPTGRVYPAATLEALAELLTRASARHGRTIYLLADEPYSRLVFDGRPFVSPSAFYPDTVITYSYGKVLLTPGQRIGWLASAPAMAEGRRLALREAVQMAQIVNGFIFPNAVMQYALPKLDALSIDLAALQRKRDRLVEALRAAGYELQVPEGTFYLLPKSPIADDWAFCRLLAERGLTVLPGSVCEAPGTFRIAFTATEEMIERAIPIFTAGIDRCRNGDLGAV
jgi:aspartate aminotransferase